MIRYTQEEAHVLSTDFLNTLLGDLPDDDKDDILKVAIKATVMRMFDEWYRCEMVRDHFTFGEFLNSQGL